MKNGKADNESDTYYSGQKIPMRDPDNAGQYCKEDVVIRYFYDNSEQKVIKIEAYTNTTDTWVISFDEAKEILEKWGIKVPIPKISPL